MKDAVQRAWTRKLWKIDTTCPEFDPESSEGPVLSAHASVVLNRPAAGSEAKLPSWHWCQGFLRSNAKKKKGVVKLLKTWKEMGNQAFACKCGAEWVNIEHSMWDRRPSPRAKQEQASDHLPPTRCKAYIS